MWGKGVRGCGGGVMGVTSEGLSFDEHLFNEFYQFFVALTI